MPRYSKLFMVKLAGAATATVVASAGMAAASPGTTGAGLVKNAKGIECITDAIGGTGNHLVTVKRVGDATDDAGSPEALVYEPGSDGRLHQVAAEYVVFAAKWDATHKSAPSLSGHQFALVGAGNRYGLPAYYELHTWGWKTNPMGTLVDFNPKVTCANSTQLVR